MKIQFLKQHDRFKPGWVIGTDEKAGLDLIAQGVARQVPEHTRALKYALGAELSFECVQEGANPDDPQPKDAIKPRFPGRKKPEEVSSNGDTELPAKID